MGKASRWLKSLVGMNRNKQTPGNENDKKEDKRRWSFTHSRTVSEPAPRRMSGDATWLRNRFSEAEDANEAIAVAAAAAEAAVAAAEAAMAVVRLTNKERSAVSRQRWAALNIQNVFRGYLARKALRALKGLVKLQAHVRGYLVRKRAAATLQSMQALIRAQATALRLARSSSVEDIPKIVEMDTHMPKSVRPNKNYYEFDSDYYTCPFSMSGPIGGPCDKYERQFRNRRRTSTAQSTPRFTDWADDDPFSQAYPVVCDEEGPVRTYRYRQAQPPSYMASTQSFQAKSTRSQSAPKHRLNHSLPSKKKIPLAKLMECRHSLIGVRMNRSYSQDREALHF